MLTGRMRVEKHSGGRYGRYEATTVGEEEASQAWDGLDEREQKFVRDVRAFVINRSFQRLLRDASKDRISTRFACVAMLFAYGAGDGNRTRTVSLGRVLVPPRSRVLQRFWRPQLAPGDP